MPSVLLRKILDISKTDIGAKLGRATKIILLAALILTLILPALTAPSRSSVQGSSTTLVLAPSTSAPFDYVVTIMLENHPLMGVGGLYPNASYWSSLLQQGAWSLNYHDASGSGSLPNYLAMVGGAAPCRDLSPDPRYSRINCRIDARNIVDSIEASRDSNGNPRTWKGYFEDYLPCSAPANNRTFCSLNQSPQGCDLRKWNAGFIPNHNPFLYYNDISNNATLINGKTRCDNILPANSVYGNWDAFHGGSYPDLFLNELNSANPANYIFFAPTHCDGFHGPFPGWTCSVSPDLAPRFPACPTDPNDPAYISCWVGEQTQMGDLYLSQLVPQILSSNLFKTGRAILFITFDEPNTNPTTPDYCPENGVPNPAASYCVPISPVTGLHRATYCPDAQEHPGAFGEACPVPGVMLGTPVNTQCAAPCHSGLPGDKSDLGGASHYSFLKTIERAWNLPTLTQNDAMVKPLIGWFNNFPSPPVVTFTPDHYWVNTGQAITFSPSTDHGMAPITYHWDFGDGTTTDSTDVTSHAYSNAGNYTVTLTATDSWGQDSAKAKTRVVTAFDLFTASMAVSQSCVPSGVSVNFVATAHGGRLPYTYSWNFGDGTGATLPTLGDSTRSYSFKRPDLYVASVTVKDNQYSNSITPQLNIYVVSTLTDCPVPSFDYSPTNALTGTNVTFAGNVTGGHKPYSYSWDLGDGTVVNGHTTVTHKFAAGNYNVIFSVRDANQVIQTAMKTVAIQTPPPPTCNNGATNPPDCNICPGGYTLSNAQCIQEQGSNGGNGNGGGQGSGSTSHTAGVQNSMMPLVLVGVAGAAIVVGSVVGLTRYRKRS